YFDRHDGQAVTCDDFVQAMTDASGIDLTQFKHWYTQAGTPVLAVEQTYDKDKQTLTLTFKQSCPATPGQTTKKSLHIPVTTGLLNADGKVQAFKLKGNDQLSQEVVLQITEAEQSFTFEQLTERPIVSVLRGFSAPVKLEFQRNIDELAFLLSHDSDTFNRWEAGQQLAGQIIAGLISDVQQQRPLQLNPSLIQAFKKLLEQSWEDLSYFSLLLNLPSETYLAEQMQVVDVDAIHQAREFVSKTLATELQAQFQALYAQNHKDESGHFDAGAIGRRRIKNTCLNYLSTLQQTEIQRLAEQQFANAKNMTDQIAALSVAVNYPHPAKQRLLTEFYQQWQNEALVIDKWFTLQAASPEPDTFATIQALLQHPAFDLKTPNRVRALIGAFSQSNPLHFHAANGQGYQFLADQIIALNAINPQVAARMTGALTTWRRYDQSRQALIKSQLERIISTPDISRDVYEVASKSLV
ncbi:MAG: DUF3458 domain-containing protein, partial [Methylococcales bacterium]|nr:DUF3458 domain-containing protein [Methylococcales bacterium]